ncbi:HD-GYP domain-containing protein [Fuchsiella alkaliacetigena]|uniref:HD-GYP domain-containing protein n=1 Tax=Fuchsiella alkaliacetigena TaxID=957042 RepID=UPI00200A662C|nr:HD domain-containing phosphohydrolase [Fuchsiella alkaliacetigena]MCK8824924.1 HD domain-containing protein [Fuchsiella alkaliacetigena]
MKQKQDLDVSLMDMVMCLSDAMDLISSTVNGHHQRVAYIAGKLAEELKIPKRKREHLILASALHDVGALSLQERLDTLNFELDVSDSLGLSKHAILGYQLIDEFEPFVEIAPLVLYHHVDWEKGAGSEFRGEQIPWESHILHLADRIDVLIKSEAGILGQVDRICAKIVEEAGNKFVPEIVEAFTGLAQKESFWFDITSPARIQLITNEFSRDKICLGLDGLYNLGKLFSQIIDFRSRFTAAHSSGVAASAEALANFIGMSEHKARKLKVAGYLHDLGKLAVPTEILEKPDKLTEAEFNIIKKHTYYTYHTLKRVKGLDEINIWASLHHERLDGEGYPFHYQQEELPLGSRIMAVADVFSAITEDRPYRRGMEKKKVLNILENMVQDGALDEDIVLTLNDNYEAIYCLRKYAQEQETSEYKSFLQDSLADNSQRKAEAK